MGKASRRKRQTTSTSRQREATQASDFGICDFCSSPNVKWGYPAEDIANSKGGWAACDTCHDLIEKGNYDGLARRTVTTYTRKYPAFDTLDKGPLIDHFKGFQGLFLKARKGPPVPAAEYDATYPEFPLGGDMEAIHKEGINLLAQATKKVASDPFLQPMGVQVKSPGDEVIRHKVDAEGFIEEIPEGFTADELADPQTLQFLLEKMKAGFAAPNVPLTKPVMLPRVWNGARTYHKALAAIYGENPRLDDIFDPQPSMMNARFMFEPMATAHPLVLDPSQMNAVDDTDWSFFEAIQYAMMAHLPFEPLYLDLGGHEKVMVPLEAGESQLQGAVIWRSNFFKVPTLAVAPIGGFEYMVGPLADKLIAKGIEENKVIKFVGVRPGKEVGLGDHPILPGGKPGPMITHKELSQWHYQSPGICWFGIETLGSDKWLSQDVNFRQERGDTSVPMVFASGHAIAEALKEKRLLDDPARVRAIVSTGMYHENKEKPWWEHLATAGVELIARMAERAMLGLYFIENAPVYVDEVPLSRPERREMERETRKGRDPGQISSIVVIQGKRSSSSHNGHLPREIEHSHRWERRGYFIHYHENNRHYQKRPDLVKSCHKCEFEYAENEAARRDGKNLPHPTTESPDCIKKWVEPSVCGPEDKPLKKKVRIRYQDKKEQE